MHLTQALTLLPVGNLNHWRLGYFFVLLVGLYWPRKRFLLPTMIEPLPQIEQTRAMRLVYGIKYFV